MAMGGTKQRNAVIFGILLLLVLPASFGIEDDDVQEAMDPLSHVATAHQMVLRLADGQVKMGTDSGDQYRAEVRNAQNGVRGVYSWLQPNGSPHVVAYNSGPNGYRTLPVAKAGLHLPPFPYSLYGVPKLSYSPDAASLAKARIGNNVFLPEEFGTKDIVLDGEEGTKEEPDVIVIGADGEDTSPVMEEVEAEVQSPDIPLAQDDTVITILPGISIPGGTPIAQSKPSATAVAGDKGTAHSSPAAQAFVGPGGVAISFPSSQAAAGHGGVAISKPVSVSSAGPGGIAIAGGTSTAFAGLQDSGHQVVYRTTPQNFAQPMIANYFFGASPVARTPMWPFPYGYYQMQPQVYNLQRPRKKFSAYPKLNNFYSTIGDGQTEEAEAGLYSAQTYQDFINN